MRRCVVRGAQVRGARVRGAQVRGASVRSVSESETYVGPGETYVPELTRTTSGAVRVQDGGTI